MLCSISTESCKALCKHVSASYYEVCHSPTVMLRLAADVATSFVRSIAWRREIWGELMIEILPYDLRWPAEFATIGAELRRLLGDLALRIDHIGSTSVPNLPAKNIIDVQLTVVALEPFAPLQNALEGGGYRPLSEIRVDHQPPGDLSLISGWNKRFANAPEGRRPANIHIRVQGYPNQRYALLFRDYVRASPAVAAAYAAVKRQLAAFHPDDITAYVTIKDPVCDLIMAGATDWATTSDWEPGPSDA